MAVVWNRTCNVSTVCLCADGQKAHWKVLNIIRGNTAQKHTETPLHVHLDGYYQKSQRTSTGEDVEKLESLCTAHWNKNGAIPQKKKKITELPQDPAIPLLVISQKMGKQDWNRYLHTMFRAALLVTVKRQKQPKCPRTAEWIRKFSIYIKCIYHTF